MVDKSSLFIILFGTMLIMLTFRDLVRQTTTLSPENNDEDIDQSHNDDFNSNKFEDDFNEKDIKNDVNSDSDTDLDDQVKTIPSLKIMKTLNQQTLKFLFW